MTLLMFLAFYFAGLVCFALWDAHIGFGVEFDGGDWPPAMMAYAGWPLTLVCAVFAAFIRTLDSAKNKRIQKAEQRKRIRVAAEKEQEALLEQIEREMSEDDPIQKLAKSLRK